MKTARTDQRVIVPMREAVGYDRIGVHERTLEGALVLKHDRLFLLLDPRGEIMPPGSGSLGLFFDDTRVLSEYALRFTGGPPVVLSSQVPAVYQAQIDLAVNDLPFGGDDWDPHNVIHIRREILLEDRLVERVTLANHLTTPIDYAVELTVGCDFADIFEVRGWDRDRRGEYYAPHTGDRFLEFAYRGTDGHVIRSTVVFADPVPSLRAREARWEFRLEPNARYVLEWEVLPESAAPARRPGRPPLDRRRKHLEERYRDWRLACTLWDTDVAEFNTTLRHAVDDLRALYVEAEGDPVISAGIPWYSTVFGRDSLIASLQTLAVNPGIAVDTLRYLARHQGRSENPYTEEQPGRILHELRRGELARSGEIPHVPYYGTIDATPLWLILLHETWRWTGDTDLVRELLPNALRALEWIDRFGDMDGDGLVEYARTSDKGLVNQGWKDSGDGVPFPDGTLPQPPIALIEVQGYVYDAKLRMAALLDAFGDAERADALRREAAALRDLIIDRFWLEELGTFALALTGDKRPVPTVTSNAGHLLWSRVPAPEQAARMADSLLGPDMFSGWGIRTLSAQHPVFNPMSYHNGSVWPHDNALVVLGLALHGFGRRALPVIDALHDAAANMRFHRLPELFCGMPRAQGMRPVLYPVSCSPQAWASGAFFLLLQALTGILPDAPAGTLHIREPQLPGFLRELTLTGLRVGRSRIAIQFRRLGERTLANLLHVEGERLQTRIELS
jgi:glycogen debranching enzyme